MRTKNMLGIAYLYVLLPFFIFLLGWCRWYVAAPGAVILVYCFFRMMKNLPELWEPMWTPGEREKMVFIFLLIVFWVYFSGVGKLVFQNTDHDWRNAIFEALVNHSWPAAKAVQIDGTVSNHALVYYIGFWMPSALVGKLLGMDAGYCFQAVWAVIGVFCVYYFVCVIRKEIAVWPLLIFIFISGLDAVPAYVIGGGENLRDITAHLEWWPNTGLQYSAMTTQLFWVFNQAVPAWLLILLLYLQKNNRQMILLLSCAMLTSTIPFVGMFPFAAYFMLRRFGGKDSAGEKIKMFLADTVTAENVLGGGMVGILSFLYLKGNISGQNTRMIADADGPKAYLFIWITFVLFEVGVYWIAIYKYQKKNVLFYIICAWLCICPWIKVGSGPDFCMRASIPALVLLYLLVVETLEKSWKGKDYLVLGGLAVLLLIGSVTPVHEFNRTIAETANRAHDHKYIFAPTVSEEELFTADNFWGDMESSFFFRYIAKQGIEKNLSD